ncbi:MAG: DNA polymerase III subunit delta' [Candidatus Omnitrophica bacterium]|nr:DNA polymerase III subunit delta' [Candidatus Omnitrophota bacterium]
MSFKDILGQENSINQLRSHIKEERLEGGYLFTGPDGVGKKFTALTIAKAINCQEQDSEPCEICPACKKINSGQHPDIHLIDADTPVDSELKEGSADTGGSEALKIGHVRQLQKEISLRPYEAKRKVFIIDNAHNLTPAASNALLKILEEPPKMSLIILVTDKPARLFKTIVSRCKIIKFPALNRKELEEVLRKDYGLDSSYAHFLAYFCEGRIGKALALKDTDILREKNAAIDDLALSTEIKAGSVDLKDREAVRGYLNVLATWFRDICLLKTGMPAEEAINSDRGRELAVWADKLTFAQLNSVMDAVSDSILYLERNINTKLLLLNLGAHLWKA